MSDGVGVDEIDADNGSPKTLTDGAPDTGDDGARDADNGDGTEELVGEAAEGNDFIDDDDDDDDEYPTPAEPNPYMPWIKLAAGWGSFLLLVIGIFIWLEATEDSTLAELRTMRPQISMEVTPPKQPLRSSQFQITPPAVAASAAQDRENDVSKDNSGEAQLDANTESTTAVSDTVVASNGAVTQPASVQRLETVAVLHPHPDPALIEKGELGPLPIVDAAGRQPWRVYSRPINVLETRPLIAIVITNLGVSATSTESAIQELPGAVTLAFAPDARRLEEWINASRAAGHEVIITLPMEPLDYPRSDTGPYGLLTTLSAEQNLHRLEWVLSRFTGYIGVTNFLGSRFTADAQTLRPVLVELKRRGLMFVDGRDNPLSVAPRLAAEVGLARAVNDIFLDQQANSITIDAQLEELEQIARANGTAVAFGQPFPVIIARLKRWVKTLNERGLVLAPVSAVAGRQTGR